MLFRSISAGYKRADTTNGVTANGLVFSLSVPLQVFNDGRYEVARYAAEQERVRARIALLEREIKTEVEGAMATVELRRKASASLETELAQPAEELIRIARVAYDEGEAGVLEVLDALRLRRNAGLKKLEMDAALREAFLELERAVGEELEVLQ